MINQTITTPEPHDYPQGYYHVRVDYANGHKPVVVDLAKLADCLPHGSGIDSDWHIKVKRTGDVVVSGEYHAMNGAGYYDGWRNFHFTLERCKRNEYKPLVGPCAGQYQVTRIRGTVYLVRWVGGGDAADYLYDTCAIAVSDALGINSISSVLVGSELAAKQLSTEVK